MASSPNPVTHRIANNLSGSCLCKGISWELSETIFGHITICHCSLCRRMSGSTSVPFISLPKSAVMSQLQKCDADLKYYQASDMATRYYCSRCGAFVCMVYHHERHTLWIPMGTLEDFSPELIDPIKDSHIFQDSEANYLKRVDELEHYESFGTYRSDNCCGKAWEELKTFDEL